MLKIDAATLRRIADHAAAGYPAEVCGLLVGHESADQAERLVVEAHRVTNLRADRSGDRYELDPKAHLHIQREARRGGLRIVGVYHSHPGAPAAPSATDRARAVEIWGPAPSWSYLILPVSAEGAGQVRAWVLRDGAFEEEPIEAHDE